MPEKPQQLIVENFRYGMDSRRSQLTSVPGTLYTLIDAHISQGGAIEKRKAWVRLVCQNTTIEAAGNSVAAVTKGLQKTAAGIEVYYSVTDALPSTPVPTDFVVVPIQHPSVVEAIPLTSVGVYGLNRIIHSTIFGGNSFIIAEFEDNGGTFCYYNGSLVEDFTSGLVLTHLVGNLPLLTRHIVRQVNLTSDYTAEQLVIESTSFSRAGSVVTVNVSGGHGLTVGGAYTVTVVPSGAFALYGITSTAITVTSSTAFTYAQVLPDNGGGTTELDIYVNVVDITGADGVDYEIDTDVTSIAGTLSTPTSIQEPVVPVAAIAAVGSFKVMGGSFDGSANYISSILVGATNTVAAIGILTPTTANFVAGETVTIGATVYTARATVAVDGEFKIESSYVLSLLNLMHAINDDGVSEGAGSGYMAAAAHTTVYAVGLTIVTPGVQSLGVRARSGGTAGNSIATTTTSVGMAWGGATLSGGVGETDELLAHQVYYSTSNAATVVDLVEAINAYSTTSGYTAEVGAESNRVNIIASTSASPIPNDYKVTVTAAGNVCIGDFAMSLGVEATPANVSISAGGTALATTVAFATTLEAWYTAIAAAINANTATHGFLSVAYPTYLRISKAVTTSADGPVTVDVSTTSASISFDPPTTEVESDLAATVPSQLYEATDTQSANISGRTVVAVTPTGGSGAYKTFSWEPESTGSDLSGGTPSAQSFVQIYPDTPTLQATIFLIRKTIGQAQPIAPGQYKARYVCKVTDGFGVRTTSNTITVNFLIALP